MMETVELKFSIAYTEEIVASIWDEFHVHTKKRLLVFEGKDEESLPRRITINSC